MRSSDPTTVLVLGPAEGHVSAHGCSPGAIELRRYGNSYEGPIPAGAVVHLATLVVWQHQPEMADIHIEGPHCSPGPDHPYFIGNEPSREVRELTHSSGSVSAPVFRINGPAPVADDATSWGGLKTLYR